MPHNLKLLVQWTSDSGGKMPRYTGTVSTLYSDRVHQRKSLFFSAMVVYVSTTYYWNQNWIPQFLISSLWFFPTWCCSVKRISRNRNWCFEWRTDFPDYRTKVSNISDSVAFLCFGILTDIPLGPSCIIWNPGRVRKPRFYICESSSDVYHTLYKSWIIHSFSWKA